jgi:hypothetical protein
MFHAFTDERRDRIRAAGRSLGFTAGAQTRWARL